MGIVEIIIVIGAIQVSWHHRDKVGPILSSIGIAHFKTCNFCNRIHLVVRNLKSIARISAEAEGTSYMPAIVVPIPLIARVQASACDGLATQLQTLFVSPEGEFQQ